MSDKVYQIITAEVIKKLEAGTIPWRKPWNVRESAPMNIRGTGYRGANVFLLLAAGYKSRWWLTYNQVNELDGQIRQSEIRSATMVVYWNLQRVQDRETGENKEIPLLRYYRVWNLEQIDYDHSRLPEHVKKDLTKESKRPAVSTRLRKAKAIIDGYKDSPIVNYGGDRAYYDVKRDLIQLPDVKDFQNKEGYYYALFHESAHSTAHPDRLDRKQAVGNAFGTHAYGREELVAEMTNAFLCAEADILPLTLENHAAYVASWIQLFKKDTKAVLVAASAAQRAADHILGREKKEWDYNAPKEKS
jgi:antirestriction protein ArdC